MSTHEKLAGRRAVITGGGSGIGAAIAEGFAAAGATVVVADLDEAAAAAVAATIVGAGGAASGHPVDVADESSVAALFTAVDALHGGVDVLVNAAGVLTRVSFLDTDEATWDRTIRVNSLGPRLRGSLRRAETLSVRARLSIFAAPHRGRPAETSRPTRHQRPRCCHSHSRQRRGSRPTASP